MDKTFGNGILDHNSYFMIHDSRSGGFTLLELLVSIGIFTIITTAVVVNFRSGQHSNELRLTAGQLASDLRALYTQAQAGTAQTFDVTSVALPAGITISSPANLTIEFKPPEPRVLINNGEIEAEARITLEHSKTNQTKTVVVKRISGRIEVE